MALDYDELLLLEKSYGQKKASNLLGVTARTFRYWKSKTYQPTPKNLKKFEKAYSYVEENKIVRIIAKGTFKKTGKPFNRSTSYMTGDMFKEEKALILDDINNEFTGDSEVEIDMSDIEIIVEDLYD